MDADPVDEAVRARRKMEPAWNELREQRVLGRISEARGRKKLQPRRLALAAGALAAAAALAVGIWRLAPEDPEVASTTPVPRESDPARLDLSDGSVALLSSDARVRIDGQREDGVFLTQQSGTVTYDVTHDPARAFVVRADNTTVTVRGTRFVVAMEPAFVEVRVEEGRVEVGANGNETILRPGEQIRVSRAELEEPAPIPDRAPPEPPVARDEQGRVAPTIERRRPEPPPPPELEPVRSLEELQREADAARRAGRVDEAARILREAIVLHETDPRAPGALFTLGRLERRRARHAEAAEVFVRAREIAPRGPLAEDALAEAAVSFHEAGVPVRAQDAARRYLDAYPDGLHAQRMRALLP